MQNGHGESNEGTVRYVGQFSNNERHGKGTLYENKDVYSGDFRFGHLNGKGFFERENGEKYNGDWKNGLMDGFGLYEWPDGSEYQGLYREGKREGKGKLYYSDGSSYDG